MSQTTNIAIAVAITTIVVGGGVFFWQNKQAPEEEPIYQGQEKELLQPAAEQEAQEEVTVTEQQARPLQDTLLLEGKIYYRRDGSAWLETNDGNTYDIHVQETTVFKNLPDTLLDERIKNLMEEAGSEYPWYGLMSDMATYVKDGTPVRVRGTTNDIIVDEMEL